MMQKAQQAFAQQQQQKNKGGGGMGGMMGMMGKMGGSQPAAASSSPDLALLSDMQGMPDPRFSDPNTGSRNWFDVPMGNFNSVYA